MRGWAARAVTVTAVAACSWSGGLPAAAGPAPAAQRLAILRSGTAAFAQPSRLARRVAEIAGRRPLTGAPTALPVIATASGAGLTWLQVEVPGRPNGRLAWIREAATRSKTTSWRIDVDLGARRLSVFEGGRRVRSVRAIIGKRSTPTPTGAFFVEELIALGPRAVGAPFALALSARSEVLQEFAGGPGQIAIHGVANVGGTLGTAVSHGCIRIDGATTRWLVHHVRTGTPVTIHGPTRQRPDVAPRTEPR